MSSVVLDTQHFIILCETLPTHVPTNACTQSNVDVGQSPKLDRLHPLGSVLMLSPSQYLTERAGLYVNLTHTGTVCKACYNMHLVVMQHPESRACAPHIQFQSDIKLWSMKMYDENTNELTKAVLATLAKKLQ